MGKKWALAINNSIRRFYVQATLRRLAICMELDSPKRVAVRGW